MTEGEKRGDRLISIEFLTPNGVILRRCITAKRAKAMHEELKQKFGDLKPSEREGLKIAITGTDGKIEILFVLDIWIDVSETRYTQALYFSES